MNLSEFLENWDGNTQIVVKTDTEEVFCGKVADGNCVVKYSEDGY